jgi:thiamine kinase-like enzyme
MPARPRLFDTLDGLLDPATLVRLLDLAAGDWGVAREPISSGLSGSPLERLTLHWVGGAQDGLVGGTAVLKRLDIVTNWLMRAASDTQCREVQFTQSPLWRSLPPDVWSPVLAVTRARDGAGAVLMQDVAESLWPASDCYQPADLARVARVLDGLAALHAAFWEDPRLQQQSWLASPADVALALSPERLAHAGLQNNGDSYGDQALRMWTRLWPLLDDDDATVIFRLLANPERFLEALAAAPATLVHGDVWMANLGVRDDRLILIDWSLVAAAPATLDSLWFAHTWHALDADRVLVEHRAELLRHGVSAVRDDDLWALLADIGWVRSTLLGAEWLVRDVIGAPTDDEEREARERLHLWCHRAAEIIRRRDWIWRQ